MLGHTVRLCTATASGEAAEQRITHGGYALATKASRNVGMGEHTAPQTDSVIVELDAVVPEEFSGVRVDRAAAMLFAEHRRQSGVSRAEIVRWLRDGSLTVDGRMVKPKMPVRGGERLRVRAVRRTASTGKAAADVAFRRGYGRRACRCGQAGLVVHPGAGNADGTLVNGLLRRRPELAKLPRAGLVHRLDKDTSGLLVVAAQPASRTALVAAMADRRIEREYLCVVEGQLIADRRIEANIGRDPRNRLRHRVRSDGRPAVTHVAVRERFSAHTFVAARLETGRTHQIRVHLASIGHPLVGDRRYGARGVVPRGASPDSVTDIRGFKRQALHAAKLAFQHPDSGEAMRFASAVPEDMATLLAALRSR